MEEITRDRKFLEWFAKCVLRVTTNKRTERYLDMFAIGLANKFDTPTAIEDIAAAWNQLMNAEAFVLASSVFVAAIAAPGVLPSAAAAFEALTVCVEFGDFNVEHGYFVVSPELERELANLHNLALTAFYIAANAELGFWLNTWPGSASPENKSA